MQIAMADGCHLDRKTLDVIEKAGFSSVSAGKVLLARIRFDLVAGGGVSLWRKIGGRILTSSVTLNLAKDYFALPLTILKSTTAMSFTPLRPDGRWARYFE